MPFQMNKKNILLVGGIVFSVLIVVGAVIYIMRKNTNKKSIQSSSQQDSSSNQQPTQTQSNQQPTQPTQPTQTQSNQQPTQPTQPTQTQSNQQEFYLQLPNCFANAFGIPVYSGFLSLVSTNPNPTLASNNANLIAYVQATKLKESAAKWFLNQAGNQYLTVVNGKTVALATDPNSWAPVYVSELNNNNSVFLAVVNKVDNVSKSVYQVLQGQGGVLFGYSERQDGQVALANFVGRAQNGLKLIPI